MRRVVIRATRDSNGNEAVKRFPKPEGVLHYALLPDGTWKEYLGCYVDVPVLTVFGPDPEAIVLTLQELRDKLDQRGTHNIRIHQCIWDTSQMVRVCLEATPAPFRPGRRELMDVLLDIRKNPTSIAGWEMISMVMRAATEAVKDEDDQETLPELYKLAVGDD